MTDLQRTDAEQAELLKALATVVDDAARGNAPIGVWQLVNPTSGARAHVFAVIDRPDIVAGINDVFDAVLKAGGGFVVAVDADGTEHVTHEVPPPGPLS